MAPGFILLTDNVMLCRFYKKYSYPGLVQYPASNTISQFIIILLIVFKLSIFNILKNQKNIYFAKTLKIEVTLQTYISFLAEDSYDWLLLPSHAKC